ncbi:hypothetical protein T10_6590 [Trichinella papuae]|uniref:Uncharacterized protein n=1 Tax=Trichinella papuae TaxID=268474 RepID=A0A0V1MUA1_9BILA|nr:hypothetical protein T10_6590 [Trichinella papuae]
MTTHAHVRPNFLACQQLDPGAFLIGHFPLTASRNCFRPRMFDHRLSLLCIMRDQCAHFSVDSFYWFFLPFLCNCGSDLTLVRNN